MLSKQWAIRLWNIKMSKYTREMNILQNMSIAHHILRKSANNIALEHVITYLSQARVTGQKVKGECLVPVDIHFTDNLIAYRRFDSCACAISHRRQYFITSPNLFRKWLFNKTIKNWWNITYTFFATFMTFQILDVTTTEIYAVTCFVEWYVHNFCNEQLQNEITYMWQAGW